MLNLTFVVFRLQICPGLARDRMTYPVQNYTVPYSLVVFERDAEMLVLAETGHFTFCLGKSPRYIAQLSRKSIFRS